jgi:sarcosine oxidase subunit gamma
VTADLLHRRTALDPHAARLAALPLRARERRFATQLNLRVAPGAAAADRIGAVLGHALPTVPCTSVSGNGIEALWLGPDEWLVLAAPDRQGELGAALRASGDGDFVAVTDVSAQRCVVELAGDALPALLARGCAIDFHPTVTPVGACVQTLLAQTGATIVVRAPGAVEVLLLVRTSFADYLVDWLEDACLELGG